MKRSLILLGALAGAGLLAGASGAETSGPPRVVASIEPIQSLVAGVMEGVAEPRLIIRGAGSPHTYSLRPSDARALQEAQVIFWVGETLETFLEKPLAALGSRAKIVTLEMLPGLTLLPGRVGGPWEEEQEEQRAGEVGHGHGGVDGHLWLDPRNAKRIVEAAVSVLSGVDPSNRARYEENGRRVNARLAELDRDLQRAFAPVKGVPFVVFHDAYQYLERRYGLRAVGSITVSPDRTPGARRIREIRAKISQASARCIFSEPQFEPRLIATLVEGTDAKTGVLDPLGADLAPGPEAYFTLMRRLAASMTSCLGGRRVP